MALTVVLWRAGRRRRRAPLAAPDRTALDRTAAELAEPDPAAASIAEPVRFKGAAAATNDRFMDAVVLISVLLFLALAVGIGVLVLRDTGLFDHLRLR
jgi:hypothetical protein